MTWIDTTLDVCSERVVINDSKTPSGRAHVGSLRGVLIHDALARAARQRGMDAEFLYGCDDMDAVDEIPHGTGEHFVKHLGKPLWAVPPPPDIDAKSMAQAYFEEFTNTFSPLGVNASFYSMSDLYRSGRLDEIIDVFLRAAPDVQKIYRRRSGAQRPDDWLPFQPICPKCGRIGTTYATDYDGETVAYHCRADLVQWATGCGSRGRVSPFGGNGKLPWKLEWAAKWRLFGVSIEGAGKDHMAASGSHEVSSDLARHVLHCQVPVPVPYEFFTLGGAKMSSSKGIGMSASELTKLLPSELLRYLVLRTQPRRAIDFDLDVPSLTKAFVEFERLWRAAASDEPRPNERQLYLISSATSTVAPNDPVPPAPQFSPPFDSLLSLVQQPHVDISGHVASLGVHLSEVDSNWLGRKEAAARELILRQPDLGNEVRLLNVADAAQQRDALSESQQEFLSACARRLSALVEWDARAIQDGLFESARDVGIDPRADAAFVFGALYQVLFGTPTGPRAGSYLAFIGQQETLMRLG